MHKDWGNFEGYKQETFTFQGMKAVIVFPNEFNKDRKWLYKTEYMGAFPDFEEEMLNRGYAVVNLENETRWCKPTDTIRQAEFIEYCIKTYNLNKKCTLVGMSCGGMQAIYLGAKYPQNIACIYIDAPVVNRLSCPCHVSGEQTDIAMYNEMVKATGWTIKSMLNDREQPLDYLDKLIDNKIPCFLVCGDSDKTVPYDENGINVTLKYQKSNVPFEVVIKKGCDHHPHSLLDTTPIIQFVEKYY